MNETTQRKALQISQTAFGAIVLFLYPLGLVWLSRWVRHQGEGSYYPEMIAGVHFVLGVFLIGTARSPKSIGA